MLTSLRCWNGARCVGLEREAGVESLECGSRVLALQLNPSIDPLEAAAPVAPEAAIVRIVECRLDCRPQQGGSSALRGGRGGGGEHHSNN